MKRNIKILGLAGALALCLLLTGCYQSPDNTTNPDNEMHFNTHPPEETATPAPVVEETVLPDSGSTEAPDNGWPESTDQVYDPYAFPTESPASNQNIWGNLDGPIVLITSQPSDGVPAPTGGNDIALITSSPYTEIPSPDATPTPKSLQRGYTDSEEVRQMQSRLKELGYYKGSPDGDFGPATEDAVKAFQKANGLSPDGKVGEQTLKKLNDKNAKTAKQANAGSGTGSSKGTATPRPTATANLQKDYYLRLGVSGSKVETLQRRLIELGWLSGKVTGTFDAATEAAVIAFQEKTSGLWTDGVAGPDTLRALYSSKAARSSRPAAVNSSETLQYGSEGTAVTTLQKRLQELGYLAGSADGKFGVETEAAVIAFQQSNNLTADGKAGTATQSKLFSGTGNRASGNAVKIAGKNVSGRDASGIASTGYETLEFGSTGEAVRKLQNRLDALGYKPGYTDGKFGASTEAAVMAFQANNNLTVDGKAGPATQRVLYGSAKKSGVDYASLRPGDSGSAVKNLQYTLYELGYYDGAIDGIYGQTTSDAVRAFQIENSLKPVDGIAGNATQGRLYSSSAIPASKAGDLYDTVRPGDRGDVVVQIQDCLASYSYLSADNINGYYDDATVAAVRAFQAAHGLKVDGICGSRTLSILFGY